ncbi:MAG: hypothetical protein AAF564_15420 [Bacteroidota bacterium]
MSALLPVPKRLSAKLCVDASARLQAASLVPVFHGWISKQAVDEVLIDVVDYSHVLHGPALMLVALEADYVLDEGDGVTGIRYIRKRAMPQSLVGAVAQVILQATRAALLLAEAPELDPPVVFDATRIEVELLDKLHYPATSAELEEALAVVADAVYPGSFTIIAVPDDPRRPLRFVIQHDGVGSLASVVNHLETSAILHTAFSPALSA